MPSSKRVLITRCLTPDVMARAARDYDAVINDDDHVMDDDEIVEKAQGADAILCCISEKYSAGLIDRLPESVKILSTFSVGTDHIDLQAAKSRGIQVGNTPDAVTVSTAEIAMLLILAAAHRASEGERMVRARLVRLGADAASRHTAFRQAAWYPGPRQDRPGGRGSRARL